MNSWLRSWGPGLLVVVLFTLAAWAQSTVQIRGKDNATTAPRDVLTDTAGRIITSPSSATVTVCSSSSKDKVTAVNTTMTLVPVDPNDGGVNDAASRVSVLVCNSAENAGTPKVKCRADGATPVMGTSGAGLVLEVSDCALYTGTGLRCIADTAATAVSTFECVP